MIPVQKCTLQNHKLEREFKVWIDDIIPEATRKIKKYYLALVLSSTPNIGLRDNILYIKKTKKAIITKSIIFAIRSP